MYHTGSYLCQALRYCCVFLDQQMQKKKKKKEKKGSCSSWRANHAHLSAHAHTLRLIQAVNCSLLRCPLSWSAGLVALILQRRLRQWKLGYCAAVSIDRTGVPRRWQGQQLIGPKWEWRGKIDCHRSTSSSSRLLHLWLWPLYAQSSVCELWCGKSHREVLAPFVKAVIMRGCEGPRSMRSRCHQPGW